MKKNLIWTLLITFFLWNPSWGETEEQRMKLKHAEGQVKVYLRKFDKWMAGESRMLLNFGDRIRTGASSRAVIAFNPENTLLIEENSEIELKSPPGKKNRIVLFFGNIYARFQKVMTGGDFEVETSDVVAGIKGTELHVGVDKKGESKMACTFSSTYLIDKNDNRRIELPKNRLVRYRIGEKIRYARFTSTELRGLWDDSFKKYYDGVKESILEDNAPVPQQVETTSAFNRNNQREKEKLQRASEQFERYEQEMDKSFEILFNLFKETHDGLPQDRRIRNTVRLLAAYKDSQRIFQRTSRAFDRLKFYFNRDNPDPQFKIMEARFKRIDTRFIRASRTIDELRQRVQDIEDQFNVIGQNQPVQ